VEKKRVTAKKRGKKGDPKKGKQNKARKSGKDHTEVNISYWEERHHGNKRWEKAKLKFNWEKRGTKEKVEVKKKRDQKRKRRGEDFSDLKKVTEKKEAK